jgi:hypothetical protein
VCDLETSRICTPYIYDISTLRVKICEENTDSVKIDPKYWALVLMATHLIFVEFQDGTEEFRTV